MPPVLPSWGTLPSGPGHGTPCLDLTWVPHHLDLALVPPSGPGRGTPHLDLARVPPSGPGLGTQSRSGPGWGTPIWTWLGTTPIWTWPGTPHLDPARVPPIWSWLGYPPSGPGWGTPPGVNRQTPVKTVPSRRTTYADDDKSKVTS